MWRLLDKDETGLLAEASRFERDFPSFYRDASATWTADEAEILAFYRGCEHLFGIFEAESIVGLVYLERLTDTHQVAHLDARRGTDRNLLAHAACGIREHRFLNGMERAQTWVLRQNRPLQRVLTEAGFLPTGLEMRAGQSHGKVLRWQQFIVDRGY